ncbi:MAG: ParA family protein [Gaiellaceae bacterium]
MSVVSFFNHKGGVGKTTIVFNTGLAMLDRGHSVVFVDADPQANLTGLAVAEPDYEQERADGTTIWAAVSPLVTGAGDIDVPDPVQIRDGAWLLPGDLRLSNFESILPVGWIEALAGEARGFRTTSALHRLFRALTEKTGADFVFVDLGPNVGALNRTALVASDGFVVPLAPDLFSLMALPSVGNSLREWSRQWKTALSNKPQTVDFDLPLGKAKPLGYVSQQFSVYGNRPAAAFRHWLDRIADAYSEGILDPLGWPGDGKNEMLGSLKNFASLVPLAQKSNKAIYELSGVEARGAQFTRAQETRATFEEIARRIDAGLDDK